VEFDQENGLELAAKTPKHQEKCLKTRQKHLPQRSQRTPRKNRQQNIKGKSLVKPKEALCL
jgi:hypothetical protein